jgi:hypothetical protein
MQLVGKSKVTRLNAKTGITYPLIRLPKAFADEIGRTAKMYKIERNSSRTLLITFSKSLESKKVIQPEPEVIQLDSQKDVEERLLELESQIADLKPLILQNDSKPDAYKENKRPRARFEPASWPPQGGFLNINSKMGLLG